ncbi:MAG: hemolysin III family protein [Erysipelotrichaceae bacterium]|nr:hemolysin III family protein [Erysipelotrichaceae bacterium]MEE3424486.1 hemolysin III family protein [Erysipelotrichaceae bacterium]
MSEIHYRYSRPYISIKDPISALTHFIGFLASIFATPLLLSKAGILCSDPIKMIGLSIYCLSLIVLYGASSAYHSFILPHSKTRILKKIDHISVFLLIAGSYTPICLSLLNDRNLLIIIWVLALCGIIMKLFWIYCPKYVSSIVYIVLGWTALLRIKAIYLALGQIGFFWLLTGGLFYTIGGIIYALHIKISDRWSEHEIFHIFVLLGSLCHYIMMFDYIV